MNQCPVAHSVRKDLPPLTERIKKLPVDERGYPVPFFVQWMDDGKPDFRVMDSRKWRACVKLKLCWVCGDVLGRHLSFVVGPMCAITRTTAEPPSHDECARWAVTACPFMTRPNMVRREDDFTRENEKHIAGLHIPRNPGVMCLWQTKSYSLFRDQNDRPLVRVGPPEVVTWWREGRAATRAEIMESIDNGYHNLTDVCHSDKERAALEDEKRQALKLLPA